MKKVEVRVQLKPEVLDPQGRAILKVLHGLGYTEVESVRVGKTFAIQVAGDDDPQPRAVEMAERLLANLVIEDYQVAVND